MAVVSAHLFDAIELHAARGYGPDGCEFSEGSLQVGCDGEAIVTRKIKTPAEVGEDGCVDTNEAHEGTYEETGVETVGRVDVHRAGECGVGHEEDGVLLGESANEIESDQHG